METVTYKKNLQWSKSGYMSNIHHFIYIYFTNIFIIITVNTSPLFHCPLSYIFFMYACMYVCMYLYIYVFIYVCVFMCIKINYSPLLLSHLLYYYFYYYCIYIYMLTHLHLRTHTHIYIYIYIQKWNINKYNNKYNSNKDYNSSDIYNDKNK